MIQLWVIKKRIAENVGKEKTFVELKSFLKYYLEVAEKAHKRQQVMNMGRRNSLLNLNKHKKKDLEECFGK
jgi:hypothetical protein